MNKNLKFIKNFKVVNNIYLYTYSVQFLKSFWYKGIDKLFNPWYVDNITFL